MRIRSTKPELDERERDRRGHFKKAAIPGASKQAVALREGASPGTTTAIPCCYCGDVRDLWWPLTSTGRVGSHMVGDLLEFDHVIPESHGGTHHPDNLVLACRPCNRAKRDKVAGQ